MKAPLAIRNEDGTVHGLNTGMLAGVGLGVSLAGAVLSSLVTRDPGSAPTVLAGMPGAALAVYWLVLGETALPAEVPAGREG